MSETTRLTLAAGPEGPRCLRPLRRRQVADTTKRIEEACDALISEGRRPSCNKVGTESGLGRTTLTRDRYKAVLARGRTRFDRVAAGMTLEQAWAAEREGLQVQVPADEAGPIGRPAGAVEKDTMAAPTADDAAATEATGDTAERERALTLRAERLEAEVHRRDAQLYHSLGLLGERLDTLRLHRAERRRLLGIVEALSAEPLPERIQRRWTDDMKAAFYDDDDGDGDGDDSGGG